MRAEGVALHVYVWSTIPQDSRQMHRDSFKDLLSHTCNERTPEPNFQNAAGTQRLT